MYLLQGVWCVISEPTVKKIGIKEPVWAGERAKLAKHLAVQAWRIWVCSPEPTLKSQAWECLIIIPALGRHWHISLAHYLSSLTYLQTTETLPQKLQQTAPREQHFKTSGLHVSVHAPVWKEPMFVWASNGGKLRQLGKVGPKKTPIASKFTFIQSILTL